MREHLGLGVLLAYNELMRFLGYSGYRGFCKVTWGMEAIVDEFSTLDSDYEVISNSLRDIVYWDVSLVVNEGICGGDDVKKS